jgi:hypothetical protein
MVVGEPVRELVTFSFWLKMALVAIGAVVAVAFQRALRRHERQWEGTLVHSPSIKALAVLTFLVWVGVIFLGRLIAYVRKHRPGTIIVVAADHGEEFDEHGDAQWLQRTSVAVRSAIRCSRFPCSNRFTSWGWRSCSGHRHPRPAAARRRLHRPAGLAADVRPVEVDVGAFALTALDRAG